MNIDTISPENTDTQIKKTYAKYYGIAQNRISVVRSKVTEQYDDFTCRLGSYMKNLGYEFDGSEWKSISQCDVAGGRKMVCRVGVVREIINDDFLIQMTPNTDGVEIYKIEITKKGQGLGTELMNILMDLSEALEVPLYLKPVSYTKDTTIEQLRKFYHGLGFRRCCKGEYWSNFQ